jgi:hypothetical protein
MAKVFASSNMIPATYKDNIGDCLIALDMAARLGINPIAVMQNMYIVNGRPAWSATFLIACVNQSGLFSTPLRYEFSGKGDDFGCVAWVLDKSGERLNSTRITIGLAKSEGWCDKNGSKWKTMPEQMLRYRAASFFARTYCPELTMGMQTREEIADAESFPETATHQTKTTAATRLNAALEKANKHPEEEFVEVVATEDIIDVLPEMNANYWINLIQKAQSESELDELQKAYLPLVQTGELDGNAETLIRSARLHRRQELKAKLTER